MIFIEKQSPATKLINKKIVKNSRRSEKKRAKTSLLHKKELTLQRSKITEAFQWLLWRDLIACNHGKKC